ncbi:acetyltransferase (GNAT) family protein [Collimonas sp. PA-H2]|uniref:GNAT family N-acetyltransferase n=1 Tax=Collimonas sp. PA-H2 TaxID=1881062 RepID=UPI000BF3A256|nr:GNAT family N-acetyltransferase [Collimonas sp. PA-H2]PFH12548.1 acetyltransferase (GNAT) family protein [Collimonas sp. PA-H2]
MEIRLARSEDYPEIVRLQLQNTPDRLTETERQQGFVVSSMDEQQLAAINQALGIVVAVDGEQLAGFVCMAPSQTQPRHPVVEAMLASFGQQQFNGQPLQQQRVFVYGPVCIGRQWRGQGILQKLLAAVKDHVRGRYELGAAFIDERNPHSLAAHVQGLKMTALAPFSCQQQRYQLVVFSTAA